MDIQASSPGKGDAAANKNSGGGTTANFGSPNNHGNIVLTSEQPINDDEVMSSITQDEATSTRSDEESARSSVYRGFRGSSASDTPSSSMNNDRVESSPGEKTTTVGEGETPASSMSNDRDENATLQKEKLSETEAKNGLIEALCFVKRSENALAMAKNTEDHSFSKDYDTVSGVELENLLDNDWKENHFLIKENEGNQEGNSLMISSYSLPTLSAPRVSKVDITSQSQPYLEFSPPSCVKEPEVPEDKKYALRGSLRTFLEESPGEFENYAGLNDFLARMEREDLPPTSVEMEEEGRRRFLDAYAKYSTHKELSKNYALLHERHANDDKTDSDLILALGHIRMVYTTKKTAKKVVTHLFNGPLIEIPVKSNMLEDGRIEVIAEENAKVRLNFDFVAAVEASRMGNKVVFRKLEEMVEESRPRTLTPWDSTSHLAFRERAKLLCANGSLKSCDGSDVHNRPQYLKSMVITDAWCLYSVTKPKTVFSNDSECLIEALENGKMPVSPIFASLLQGPNVKVKQSPAGNILVSPLPATKSQESIFKKLFIDGMPLVVADGPPGTGKTQSIVNCAAIALCNGFQPLVTSNNAKALVPFKEKLPVALRKLCIDISSFDEGSTAGLRQALVALREEVAGVKERKEEYEQEVKLYAEEIRQKKEYLLNYDKDIESASERKRALLQNHDVKRIVKLVLQQEGSTPGIVKSVLAVPNIKDFFEEVDSSGGNQGGSPGKSSSFEYCGEVSDDLLVFVSRKAGKVVAEESSLAASGDIDSKLAQLKVNGRFPVSQEEWCNALKALRHKKWESDLEAVNIHPGGLEEELLDENNFQFGKKFLELFQNLSSDHREVLLKPVRSDDESKMSRGQRREIINEIQSLESKYVVALVMLKLSSSLSHHDLSTLSELSQLASKGIDPKATEGKAKRRHDAFVDTFKKAIKVIPLPVMSAKQVSRYCPADHMFGLGIIDEASQSNCTAINIMARCSQLVVVGDDKQVSPDGSFVKEEIVEYLDKRKPSFPGAWHLLPGSSFFDLCKVAFPCSHVFLQDHFRCRPEIIACSNNHIYGGRLNPLRLPSTDNTLVDIRVNGVRDKKKKTNQMEADTIADLVYDEIKNGADKGTLPWDIFAISMGGLEQVKLLRDCIEEKVDSLRTDHNYGPDLVDAHNISVGTASQCQGGERDVVFLSGVYSADSVWAPTNDDKQLQEERNWNVGVTRAKEKLVLVRSYDPKDIKNQNDIKRKYLSYFINARKSSGQAPVEAKLRTSKIPTTCAQPWNARVRSGIETLFVALMKANGLEVSRVVGKFWKNAFYIGLKENMGVRALVYIETGDEDKHQRKTLLDQQSSLERAGRVCLQVDGISLLFDTHSVEKGVLEFLASVGISAQAKNSNPASLKTSSDGSYLTASTSSSTKRKGSSSTHTGGASKHRRITDDDDDDDDDDDEIEMQED